MIIENPATGPLRTAASPVAEESRQPRQRPGAHGWSWVWLALGAAMLPFAGLQTLVPIVAWVAPILLLRFTRTQHPAISLPVLVVVMSLGSLVALRGGFFPIAGGLDYALFVAGLGIGGAAPYAVDRLLAPRLGSLSRTLVFPVAVTATEFLATFGNPFGTAGSVAYSQYANLPLVQLVSLTGIWGLTFLVSWLASVVNQIWESGFSPRTAAAGPMLFLVAVCAVLVFGGIRLAFPGPTSATVRVAALAPDRELSDLAYAAPSGGARTTAERAAVRNSHLTPVLDDLFARSGREARAGAKIISWSEAAALVLEEDQPAVLARAAELARQEQVYLQISMIVLLAEPDPERGIVNENHAVLLDPTGAVVWDYLKSKPTPGDGHPPGPGVHSHRRHALRPPGHRHLPGRLLPRPAPPGRPGRRRHPAAPLQRLGKRGRLARPAGAVPRRRERSGPGPRHSAGHLAHHRRPRAPTRLQARLLRCGRPDPGGIRTDPRARSRLRLGRRQLRLRQPRWSAGSRRMGNPPTPTTTVETEPPTVDSCRGDYRPNP